MTETVGKQGFRNLPKELRYEAQRTRILDAAISLVVERGFHAASMSELARAAQMSVGQIYRYFANKEAIMQAVVRRMVERRVQWIASHALSPMELQREIAQHLAHSGPDMNRDDHVLMLEITAEATRNVAVRQILREADEALTRGAMQIIRRAFPEMTESEIRVRVEIIAALDHGGQARRINQLNAVSDSQHEIFQAMIERALLPLPQDPAGPAPGPAGH